MPLTRLASLSLLALLTTCPSAFADGQNPVQTATATAMEQNLPLNVFSDSAASLEYARKRVRAEDPSIKPATDRLLREANALLKQQPLSVLDKKKLAVSGNPHDFFSMGPYWWPNPNTADGLPYVRRDGQQNPETVGLDGRNLTITGRAVYTLALAYYLTGNERYAQNAIERLRIWFLDPATAMNPHLQYAQAIPGITDGRDIGIIDTVILIQIVDAIGLLEGSAQWTAQLDTGMKDWMKQYLHWLLTSENGISEGRQHNNHGTFYDAQIGALALYTGQNDLARKITAEALAKRLHTQVTAEGDQPHEMSRTLSMNYSAMNARGMLILSAQSDAAGGVDWWNHESADGISIRKLFTFLAPYIDENTPWPKKDIREDNVGRRFRFRELITRAAAHSGDPQLSEMVSEMAKRDEFRHERWHFYLPAAE